MVNVPFIHAPEVSEEQLSADGEQTIELPCYPISTIWITIEALNNGALASIGTLIDAINSCRVEYKKKTVKRFASGRDLLAAAAVQLGRMPWSENVVNTDNAVRHVSLPILFGRYPGDPDWCFPETSEGELKLIIDWDIADTGYDTLKQHVEVLGLPSATPTKFVRHEYVQVTPSATGELQVNIPRGNVILGYLIWGTTIPSGTSWTATVDYIEHYVNNLQHGYAKVFWESLHGMLMRHLSYPGNPDGHIHQENLASTYTQNADTGPGEPDDSLLANYGYLDFDFTGDQLYALDTRALKRVHFNIYAGDTNPFRIYPVELVEAASLGLE